MSDSEEKSDAPRPERLTQPTNTSTSAAAIGTGIEDTPQGPTVEQAKAFLKDGFVQSETRERKIEFLKGKGLKESKIITLLDQLENKKDNTEEEVGDKHDAQTISSASGDTSPQPPIITYPEFLTQRTKPPPLMTMNGFLNTCLAFGGVSSLIYATSQLVLQPMVESLTDARLDLHSTAKTNLAQLVEKLEATVSEIPAYSSASVGTKITRAEKEDDEQSDSSYDDPTELFHRDVGVQTSPPPSPPVGLPPGTTITGATPESVPASHAKIVSSLVSSLHEIREGCDADVDEYVDVRASLNMLRDEVSKVSAQARTGYSQYSLFSASAAMSEPDDEIKKAKENIRRVKGVLLASRSFPTRAV